MSRTTRACSPSRVVALRLHLDDSGPGNGPLRVLPGTHALGVLTDADVQRVAAGHRPFECVVPAGGVVVMRPLIVHASSKAVRDRPRAVIHIDYADSLQMEDGLVLAVA
jgi:hypothetical protein